MTIVVKQNDVLTRISLESLLPSGPYEDDDDEPIDPEECSTCNGSGGWDVAKDCEVYDEWEDCPDCLGTGEYQND